MTIYCIIITNTNYFASNQQLADGGTINWHRLLLYHLFNWSLFLYLQSIGNLIGVIFVDNAELGIIVGLLAHSQLTLVNGLVVDLDATGQVALIEFANAIGLKWLIRVMLYAFFGVDKCDLSQGEVSSTILNIGIDPSKLVTLYF